MGKENVSSMHMGGFCCAYLFWMNLRTGLSWGFWGFEGGRACSWTSSGRSGCNKSRVWGRVAPSPSHRHPLGRPRRVDYHTAGSRRCEPTPWISKRHFARATFARSSFVVFGRCKISQQSRKVWQAMAKGLSDRQSNTPSVVGLFCGESFPVWPR